MELLTNLDIELFYLINNFYHSPFLDGFANFIDILVGYLIVVIYAFVVVYIMNRKKFTEFFILGSISVVSSFMINSIILKQIFQRSRPEEVLEDIILIGSTLDRYSFPSGHTAVAFSFFMMALLVLGTKDKLVVPVLGIVALLTAVGRVYVGHHFPFDVLAGAVLGMTISAVIYYVVFKIMKVMFDDQNEAHY